MKIETDGNEVVCSLEDKNKAFLSACAGIFNGFLHGKLKLEQLSGQDEPDEAARVSINVYRLETLIENAQKFGICVGQPVTDMLDGLKSRLNAICPPIVVQPQQPKQTQWERLCKNGCGNCTYKRRWNDDFVCTANGELLDERNRPGIINGIYYLFNYVVFPSENCPFNTNKTKGDIKNERISEACAGSAQT